MRAIELNSKTDNKGQLKIEYQLDKMDSPVRVLILLEEEDEEKIWLDAISNNPSFEFLRDSSEDIYFINDGEQYHD